MATAVTCACCHPAKPTHVPARQTSTSLLIIKPACPTAQQASSAATQINAFHSGGNVTQLMIVEMDQMNLLIALSLNASLGVFSVEVDCVLSQHLSAMERMIVEIIRMN